jgi:nicotinamidase-related amidase
MPRARKILDEVFPPLLAAVRRSPLPVFHVVGGGRDYYSHLPGHQRAVKLTEKSATPSAHLHVEADPIYDQLNRLRHDAVTPGADNAADVHAGFAELDFAPQAVPIGDEGIAENGAQLAALCRAHQINHLIYVGFAINWCLLMSPGGMIDMARHGCLCSTIREAVTAVENRETARDEREKQQALWRTSVEFGFVFSLPDFVAALSALSSPPLHE